jgi:hypothetical protein
VSKTTASFAYNKETKSLEIFPNAADRVTKKLKVKVYLYFILYFGLEISRSMSLVTEVDIFSPLFL